ncbi:hypothetical protein DFS33DRAFT_1277118 [Desarmillaria ectypa]|nr:hypothetical protein DFS33DRAFT_1277118 [Desarmillaria ectypa]
MYSASEQQDAALMLFKKFKFSSAEWDLAMGQTHTAVTNGITEQYLYRYKINAHTSVLCRFIYAQEIANCNVPAVPEFSSVHVLKPTGTEMMFGFCVACDSRSSKELVRPVCEKYQPFLPTEESSLFFGMPEISRKSLQSKVNHPTATPESDSPWITQEFAFSSAFNIMSKRRRRGRNTHYAGARKLEKAPGESGSPRLTGTLTPAGLTDQMIDGMERGTEKG